MSDLVGEYITTAILPGFRRSRYTLGIDGSVNEEAGLCAWAAVNGAGEAMFGWFTDPRPTSQLAEMQAIRYGLRDYEDDCTVRVRADNVGVIERVQEIAVDPGRSFTDRTKSPWGCEEGLAALAEVTQHARRLTIDISYVGDPEGTTLASRAPADRAMKAAHRLSWVVQRCARFDVPLSDPDVREWIIEEFAVAPERHSSQLIAAFRGFLSTYPNEWTKRRMESF